MRECESDATEEFTPIHQAIVSFDLCMKSSTLFSAPWPFPPDAVRNIYIGKTYVHTPASCMNDDKVRKWMCNERYCFVEIVYDESELRIESFSSGFLNRFRPPIRTWTSLTLHHSRSTNMCWLENPSRIKESMLMPAAFEFHMNLLEELVGVPRDEISDNNSASLDCNLTTTCRVRNRNRRRLVCKLTTVKYSKGLSTHTRRGSG